MPAIVVIAVSFEHCGSHEPAGTRSHTGAWTVQLELPLDVTSLNGGLIWTSRYDFPSSEQGTPANHIPTQKVENALAAFAPVEGSCTTNWTRLPDPEPF